MRVLAFDVGARNLSFCVLHFDGGGDDKKGEDVWPLVKIRDWEVVDCIEESGCKVANSLKIPAHKVAIMVTNALRRRRDIIIDGDLTSIVIEQQPLRRGGVGSARNKIVSHVVMSVCHMMRSDVEAPVIPIVMQPAKHKLKIRDENWEDPESLIAIGRSDTYHFRKKAGVTLCAEVLGRIDQMRLKRFQDTKGKRDDLADAFLHAMWFVQNQTFPAKRGQKRKRAVKDST